MQSKWRKKSCTTQNNNALMASLTFYSMVSFNTKRLGGLQNGRFRYVTFIFIASTATSTVQRQRLIESQRQVPQLVSLAFISWVCSFVGDWVFCLMVRLLNAHACRVPQTSKKISIIHTYKLIYTRTCKKPSMQSVLVQYVIILSIRVLKLQTKNSHEVHKLIKCKT